MDDVGKALYMGAGALLFIIALSASVILYGRIMDSAEKTIVISDFGNRAESGSSVYDVEDRVITRAEVLMSVIKINSLDAKEIIVISGTKKTTFKHSDNGDYNIKIVRNGLEEDYLIADHDFSSYIEDGEFLCSYDYINKILTYKKEE